MVNKRGMSFALASGIIGTVLLIVFAVVGFSYLGNVITINDVEVPSMDTVGFEDSKVFGLKSAKFLNYIFGEVPIYLTAWATGVSAGIIMIGLWVVLLVTFGDVMSLFSMFRESIGWLIAVVLTIVAANVKLLTYVSVVALSLTAGLGVIAIFLSLALVFILFVGFNFGTSALRKKLIERRAEDAALEATAGGIKAASAIEVLADVHSAAKKAAKKK
jgi:hypothetical protein